MQFLNIIEKVTKEFIETFNDRDFDKLALFLANSFYVVSENVQKVYPDMTENKICGVTNAIMYWQKLVEIFPYFKFKPEISEISSEGKNIKYSGNLANGKPYKAQFIMNEYAKIECLQVEYPESI